MRCYPSHSARQTSKERSAMRPPLLGADSDTNCECLRNLLPSCSPSPEHCAPQPLLRSARPTLGPETSSVCAACMTRTPPKHRRRLTGGASRPVEGILRHAPMREQDALGNACSAATSGPLCPRGSLLLTIRHECPWQDARANRNSFAEPFDADAFASHTTETRRAHRKGTNDHPTNDA